MPLPAPYAPPWKRLGEELVATLAWLRLKLREWARRNGEGTLPVPGFWPRRWPQLFWPLVLVIALAASIAVGGMVRHRLTVGVQGPERQTSSDSLQEMNTPAASPPDSPAAPKPVASPQAPSPPEQIGESPAEEQPAERPLPTNGDQKPEQAPEEEDDPLLAEWSGADPEGLLEAIRPDPANATLTLQPSGTFLALSPAHRLRHAERWQSRATDWGYSHLELVDGAGRLVGREAQVGEGMILFEAADAGGSPPTDAEVGERDGMFGNRAGGTGGALGGAPDARRGHWAGLLGHQRRGADSGAHGGVHRQPQAAAR